jgi:hypothetical protein
MSKKKEKCLPVIPKESTTRLILIAPSEIHFLRFVIEAYEGIGMVTTLDPRLGLVRLSIAPGCEGDIDGILQAEGSRLGMRAIALDADIAQS